MFVVNSAVTTYNAALNRTAYQSSVYNHTNGVILPAHYANDGSRHTLFYTDTYCAVTNKEANPWWAVDLGQPMAIYRVDLTTSRLRRRKTNITGSDLLILSIRSTCTCGITKSMFIIICALNWRRVVYKQLDVKMLRLNLYNDALQIDFMACLMLATVIG